MAMAGVATWMIMPVLKVARYLALEPELHRKRIRATAFSLVVAALIVVSVGMIRFPVHYRAEGYAEPQEHEVLHATEPGFVREILVKDGDIVRKGQELLRCRDDELDLEIAQLKDTITSLQLRRDQARVKDPNREESELVMINANTKKLQRALERQQKLTVCAPIAGRIVAPKLKELADKYVSKGEELAMVASMDQLLIKVLIDQSDAQLNMLPNAPDVEVRMSGAIEASPLKSQDIHLIPAAQKDLPHPSLGTAGGGEVQTSQRDPNKPLIEQFEIWVKVANPPGAYHPEPGALKGQSQYFAGQRAYLRFTLRDKQPLMWQWWRKLLQLIETHSKTRWA
jgi:putative peptide zinc metalloprotease protein